MKTVYFAVFIWVLVLAQCFCQAAPPLGPQSFYLNQDYEQPVPLGPGSGGMIGYGSGVHQGVFTIIADAAPDTGETQSLNFTKTGLGTGYLGAYIEDPDTNNWADTIGYVIESVFRVNSDETLSGSPTVLKASRMSADFWVEPHATSDTLCYLRSWQGGVQSMEITLDQWHRIQGVRVNPTGTDEFMDYYVDGVYWRSSGESINDGLYNNRIDIGYTHDIDVGSIDFDHLWIYEPAPYVPSPYGEWDAVDTPSGDDCENPDVIGWVGQGSAGAASIDTSTEQAHGGSQSYKVGTDFPTGFTLEYQHYFEYAPDTYSYRFGTWFYIKDDVINKFHLFSSGPGYPGMGGVDGNQVFVTQYEGQTQLSVWKSGATRYLPIDTGTWHYIEYRRVSPTEAHIALNDRLWQTYTISETYKELYSSYVTIGIRYGDAYGWVYYDDFFIGEYVPVVHDYYFYSDMEAYAQNDGKWQGHGFATGVTFGTTEAYAYEGVGSMRWYKELPDGQYFYLSTESLSAFQVPELGPDGYTASCAFYVPTVQEQLDSEEGVSTAFEDIRLMKCYDAPDTDVRNRDVILLNAAYEDSANPGQFIDILSPYADKDLATHVKVGSYVDGVGMQSTYVTRGEWHTITYHRESETNTNIYIDGALLSYYSNWPGKYMNRVDLPSASQNSIGEVFIDEVIVKSGGLTLPDVFADINQAVRIDWGGDENADYRVEYDDGGGWTVLDTVTGTEYVDTATSDPSARTYRVFRVPKIYFSDDAEGASTALLWQHDATVGTDICPFDYSTTVANSPSHSLWLRDQTVSEFSNGHSDPGFSVGIPHTLKFNLFIPPNGDEFLNYTLMGIATTAPGVYDPNRVFTDVKFDVLSGFATGSPLTMTMTYGDGVGDTMTSTTSLPLGQWNEIVVERTAVGSVNVELNTVQVLSGVAPIDGSAGDDAQTLWIGQMFGSATSEAQPRTRKATCIWTILLLRISTLKPK